MVGLKLTEDWLYARAKRASGREIFFRVKEVLVKNFLVSFPKGPELTFDIPNVQWFKISNLVENFASESHEIVDVKIYGIIWGKLESGRLAWHQLPNGQDLSDIPAFSIEYKSQSSIMQDIRITWELNRLIWLVKSAARQESKYRDLELGYFRDFLRTDRPGLGPRWNSMIELAIQSISIQFLASIFKDQLSESDIELVNSCLSNRFFWLKKLPSRYSSANNHRIAELCALIILAEGSKHSESSYKFQDELVHQLNVQTCSDGLNAEKSSSYHLFVLDLLITLLEICPDLIRKSALKFHCEIMARASRNLRIAFNGWPSFGDSDDSGLLGSFVGKSNKPIFLESFCLSEQEQDIIENPKAITSFIESGFTVIRSPNESNSTILIDHGPLGFGEIFAHAHADTLAIWANYKGVPLFVEAGTYSYNSMSAYRDYFRSGWMHNTVTVDGESLSKPVGPFLWNPAKASKPHLIEISEDAAGVNVICSASFSKSISHKKGHVIRSISLAEKSINIEDKASSGKSIESHFIVSPKMSFLKQYGKNQVCLLNTVDEKFQVVVEVSLGSKIEISHVEISDAYGQLISTIRLTVVGVQRNNTKISFLDEKDLS